MWASKQNKSSRRRQRKKLCHKTTTKPVNNVWLKAKLRPNNDVSNFIKINDYTFLMIPKSTTHMVKSCHMYNNITNKWSKPFLLNEINIIRNIKATNYHNKKLYILTFNNNKKGKIMQFGMTNNVFKLTKTFTLSTLFDKNEKITTIFANNEYHVLRTSQFSANKWISYHYIWYKNKNKLVKIHKFDEDYSNASLIVKSTNILIVSPHEG
eukprot:19614_1